MSATPLSLLQRLRNPSDARAWERLSTIYTPLLFYWARRSGLQDADCADLVQDVFAVLVRKLPEFEYDPRRGFRKWLRTITLNKCRDHQRKRAATFAHNDPDALANVAAPEDDGPWEHEYRQFVLRGLLEIVKAEFHPPTWQAYWKCAVEGRSAADVGKELNMTPGAVRAAKFRVLAHLRTEIAGLFD